MRTSEKHTLLTLNHLKGFSLFCSSTICIKNHPIDFTRICIKLVHITSDSINLQNGIAYFSMNLLNVNILLAF